MAVSSSAAATAAMRSPLKRIWVSTKTWVGPSTHAVSVVGDISGCDHPGHARHVFPRPRHPGCGSGPCGPGLRSTFTYNIPGIFHVINIRGPTGDMSDSVVSGAWFSYIFGHITLLLPLALSHKLDGLDGFHISAATADVARQGIFDFFVGRVRGFIQERPLAARDHARRAKTALGGVLFVKGLLDGIQLALEPSSPPRW